jgi:hypothetical protein
MIARLSSGDKSTAPLTRASGADRIAPHEAARLGRRLEELLFMRLFSRFPRRAALAVAAALSIAPLALADGDAASPSYRFFFPQDLAQKQEEFVGTGVKVVDELCKIWEDQQVEGYLRFDTKFFRCAVPTTDTEGIALLREVQKTHDDKSDSTPPLVAVYGILGRAELFGPVKDGKDAGVASEEILIKVDKIEKPRKRFWDEPQGHAPKQ